MNQSERKAESIEALWQDDRYWRWGFIYSCKDDPRAVVPSRLPGWTWNFGHPRVFSTMAFFILIAVGPTLAALALLSPIPVVIAAMLGSVAVVVLMAHRMASTS